MGYSSNQEFIKSELELDNESENSNQTKLQETNTETQINKIRKNAIKIAKNLTTETIEKKHGAYLIYADDRITIFTDTYMGSVGISIKGKNSPEEHVVFEHNGSKEEFYIPGKWEVYLDNLAVELVDLADSVYSVEKVDSVDSADSRRAAI